MVTWIRWALDAAHKVPHNVRMVSTFPSSTAHSVGDVDDVDGVDGGGTVALMMSDCSYLTSSSFHLNKNTDAF